MHELSIAMSLIEITSEEAARQGGAVLAVHLELGEFSGVAGAALCSAFELAREGTPLAAAELIVKTVPLTAFCPACRRERPVRSVQELVCRDCGAPAGEIVHGKELKIVAMEIES